MKSIYPKILEIFKHGSGMSIIIEAEGEKIRLYFGDEKVEEIKKALKNISKSKEFENLI